MKRQPSDWEKTFVNDATDKGLIFKTNFENFSSWDWILEKKNPAQSNKNTQAGNLNISSEKTYRWPTGMWKDA